MRCSTCVNGDRESCGCLREFFRQMRRSQRQGARSTRQGHQAFRITNRDPTNVPATPGSGRGEHASGGRPPAHQAAQTELTNQPATRGSQTSQSTVIGQQPLQGTLSSQSGSAHRQTGGSASVGRNPTMRVSPASRGGSTRQQPVRLAGGRERSTFSRVYAALSDLPCRDTAPSCEGRRNSTSRGEAEPEPELAGQSGQVQARRAFFREPPISAPYTTESAVEPNAGPKRMNLCRTGGFPIQTRIETEIMLAPKFSYQYRTPLGSFVKGIVELYNEQKPAAYPEMAEWWVEGEIHPRDNNYVWMLGGFSDVSPTLESPRKSLPCRYSHVS